MAVPPRPPDWHLTETYKSLITLTVEALKMLALINGGAAIAILTYVGNLHYTSRRRDTSRISSFPCGGTAAVWQQLHSPSYVRMLPNCVCSSRNVTGAAANPVTRYTG
jgi:hypothetical protein